MLADRLVQPVAGGAVGVERCDERLAHELIEHVDRPERGRRVEGAHGLDAVEVGAAAEDGEVPEDGAFGVVEQPDAPVDGVAHAALPSGRRARTAAEHVQLGVEPGDELGEAHRSQACRGELDRQRHPVESGAQLDDDADVVRRRDGSRDGPGRRGW